MYAHTDQLHFIKTGNWDLISWEHTIYSYVQRACQFPVVCERYIDYGAGSSSGALVLHKVLCFNRESKNCREFGFYPLKSWTLLSFAPFSIVLPKGTVPL